MSGDAHARCPESLRLLFKKWRKCSLDDIETSTEILDTATLSTLSQDQVSGSKVCSAELLSQVFTEFLPGSVSADPLNPDAGPTQYAIRCLPGLFVYPTLLPVKIQEELLSKLLHRDLSNRQHKTNLHLHYEVPYPCQEDQSIRSDDVTPSFFKHNRGEILSPKEPSIHKRITVEKMLDRKLRWLTIGGQYNWTDKVYPAEKPPKFPQDVSHLLHGIWPTVDAQAAIVNFYSPGDTLSVHRDVSEECDRGLISISIGCDGLFVIGNSDGSCCITLRLRSGDAVLMSGKSRFAWHAVPRIIANTCPAELQNWPMTSQESDYASWKGWLASKRINLNVRQMSIDHAPC